MRVFVFLLVLVNLLFLVWTQGSLGSKASPDAYRLQQQLLADQVTIVGRGEPPAAMEKAKKAEKTPDRQACLLWSDLPIADEARLERLLEEKFFAFKPLLRSMKPGNSTYWVFIPPLASKPDADRKAGELKNFGVADFFIVQDAGPNRFAISLGIFSSESAASEHLDTLRAKGIRSARMGERSVKPALASVEVNGPEAQAELLRQAVAELLPESRSVACKATATAQ